MSKKKAIISISFGSTFDETRENDIKGIENALINAFPAYDVFSAFTSNIIRKRLAERGIIIDDTETIIQRLLDEGYKEIVLQPTHLLHGEEFEQKVLALKDKYISPDHKIIISQPLIVTDNDYRLAAAAMAVQCPVLSEDEGVVLMGHGTPRANNKAYHTTYVKLQKLFDAMELPILIGTVEEADIPNLDDVVEKVKERGYKHVHLYPFMVVAGDHANNDMYSDDPESWKSRIEALGVTTTGHLNGIGRYKAIQTLYVQHVLQALAANDII